MMMRSTLRARAIVQSQLQIGRILFILKQQFVCAVTIAAKTKCERIERQVTADPSTCAFLFRRPTVSTATIPHRSSAAFVVATVICLFAPSIFKYS